MEQAFGYIQKIDLKSTQRIDNINQLTGANMEEEQFFLFKYRSRVVQKVYWFKGMIVNIQGVFK